MKKISLLLIFCLITIHTFAIDVVELRSKNADKVVVKVMFLNGSICDPLGKAGITNLTASLMMEGGTGTMTSSDIKNKTYPWASRWSASVDKEVTIFTFEFHRDHSDLFFPIMTGLIVNPSLDASDFTRIKSNNLNYVNEVIRASSDEDFSKMGLEDLLFRGTNYQWMVTGTSQGLESITLDDVKQHYKNSFSLKNISLGIAGNYSDEFVQKLKTEFEKLPATMIPPPVQGKARFPEGIQVEIISKSNALGSAIFTGYPLAITRQDNEFAALMIANSWLGEHRKSYSKLYQKIREQRSMNYGDYSYIEWYDNGGSNMLPQPGFPRSSNYFSVWIRPVQTAEGLKSQYPELKDIKIGHAHFALRMAIREIESLAANGMTQEQFELTRDFLKSYMKLYVQTPAKQLGFLMDSRYYGRRDYISDMDNLLSEVTLAQVNEAVKMHMNFKAMYVTIVTDDSEAEPLKQSLMNNSDSPMSYSDALRQTLPASILEEDEIVAKYPLKIWSVDIVSDQLMFKK